MGISVANFAHFLQRTKTVGWALRPLAEGLLPPAAAPSDPVAALLELGSVGHLQDGGWTRRRAGLRADAAGPRWRLVGECKLAGCWFGGSRRRWRRFNLQREGVVLRSVVFEVFHLCALRCFQTAEGSEFSF